jgi:transposase
VLRLPPYFCIFNPIELIWGQLKKRIRRKNTNPKFEKAVQELIRNEVAKINAEDWIKKIEKTIKEENEYRSLGQLISNRDANEQFIINLEDSDDDNPDDDMFNDECNESEV